MTTDPLATQNVQQTVQQQNQLQLSIPTSLSLMGDVATNWKTFKQRWEFYSEASGAAGYEDKRKACLFLHVIGEEAVKVYNNFTFTDENDKFKVDAIIAKFDEYCNPKKNETFERHKFFTRTQRAGETIEQFANVLRTLSKTCDFGRINDTLIRDRLVCGITDDSLRERMLRREDLTLDKALTMGRIAESSSSQIKSLRNENTSSSAIPIEINQNTKQTPEMKEVDIVRRKTNVSSNLITNCFFCKRDHQRRKCPAYGAICNRCNQKNHYEGSQACKRNRRDIHTVNVDESSADMEDAFFIGHVKGEDSSTSWTVDLDINGKIFNFYLDSGAQANILSDEQYQSINPRPKLHKTNARLLSYNGNIETLGYIVINVVYMGKAFNLRFYIVTKSESGRALLGLDSCIELELIKRVETVEHRKLDIEIDQVKVQNILEEYEDVFGGVGRLPGEYHITVSEGLPRIAHAARRFPLPLMPKLKAELDRMVEASVITPVTEPTQVCSSMVVVEKPSTGQLRICLDAPELNKYILRENCQIPTKEEIQAKCKDAKVFSKIDASAAFWHLKLDEESSYLCTFSTPFGRFRFLVMAYGIKSASEIFHRELWKLFEDIEGVVNIHDDIIIYSNNAEEHLDKLLQVLEICRQNGIKLNLDKLVIGVKEVPFFGELLTDEGVKPDPAKIAAIRDMLHPVDKKGLSRFLGLINYLSKFIPQVSERTLNLRKCLNSEQYNWGPDQTREFEDLKDILMQEPILKYYDPNRKTKIEVDSSEEGFGAVLLQEHNGFYLPVAYGARVTNRAERNYAPLERETLAICFGCEYFHQYIYGLKNVVVESDHKPLVPSFRKYLRDNPGRIQRFRMRMLKYNITVQYVPGQRMILSDTLSRSRYDHTHEPKPDKAKSDEVEIHVNMIRNNLPVSKDKWLEIQVETNKDNTLNEIRQYTRNGWPSSIKLCSLKGRAYWSCRDEISVIDNVLLKGDRIIIPQTMQQSVLQKLHMGHLGIEKIRRLARSAVFWPRINQDIDEVSKTCETCQKYQNQQTSEPLKPHEIPVHPWQHIAGDFCVYQGQTYLVVVDHYSFYPEAISVPTTSAKVAIKFLKSLFARHGIPETLRADNMPFGSEEMIQFSRDWEFEIRLSSPEYPKSNGLAEKGVQVIKNLIKKSIDSNQDINLALLAFRSAPNEFGHSPAQLLFGRQIKGKIPILRKELSGRYDIKNKKDIERKQQKQKLYHDKQAKKLSELKVGDKVAIRSSKGWDRRGSVVKTDVAPRSYLVDTGKNTLRRNRIHLRNTPTNRYSGLENAYEDDLSEEEIAQEGVGSKSVINDMGSVNEESPFNDSDSIPVISSAEQTSSSSSTSTRDGIDSGAIRQSNRLKKKNQKPDYEYY